jgi:hypothetical protein
MARFFSFLFLLLGSYSIASAQCDKKYKLKPERIVTIQSDGSEGEELPFTAEIIISKDSVVITVTLPDGNTAEIKGKHSETVCKMNADYTEGTIEYKTDAEMTNGSDSRQMKMSFTLEAKSGKLKLFGVPEDQQGDKICFIIKEKEEIK